MSIQREYFRRPAFSKWRFTASLVLSTLIVMSVITLWWAERQLSGPLIEWARHRVTNIATRTIHEVVASSIASTLDTQEMITIQRPDGPIPLIQYQMGVINQLSADAAAGIVERLDQLEMHELSVPLGELAGMSLFSARGPRIPVHIMTTGSVTAEPKVDFVAAGINQVSHRIYLDIEVQMMVVAPFVKAPVVIKQPVYLAEAILPGEVPDTYVNLIGYSGSLAEWSAIMSSIDGSF